MDKVLVLGANGLLGQSLIEQFKNDFEVIASSVEDEKYFENEDIPYFQTDLTMRYDVADLINAAAPDIIINCAAMTNVDLCEKEREMTWKLNVKAIENILESCQNKKPLIVQISSDYVFDGNDAPYSEIDVVNPVSYYGRSKLSAENIVKNAPYDYIIARTQILYGTGKNVRPNFVTWVINALRQNEKIRIVNDQKNTPTYVNDLSEGLYRLIMLKEYGLFHISGSESISRYDFAMKIADVFNLNSELIEEITSDELQQSALRPQNSSFVQNKFINRTRWETHNITDGLQLLKVELEKEDG
jgi:dTDP-4-dehydrorhamnose reductase